MMKKLFIFSSVLVFSLSLAPWGAGSLEAQNPLYNKIIALDAGHGGDYTGAFNSTYGVAEKDVNLMTVYALKEKLKANGACVVLTRVCDETISSRKERVKIAKQKCESDCQGECDVLVSIHHNGSTDPSHDGTLVIYNTKGDFSLAQRLHDSLIAELGLPDEGYDRGGYGMTVYFTPASITEGYYISNQCEAELYLRGTRGSNCDANIYPDPTEGEASRICTDPDDSEEHTFKYYPNRVNQEVEALYQGLIDYFSISGDGGNGGGGGKCPPAKQRQGKC